jgi:hypothetical protein
VTGALWKERVLGSISVAQEMKDAKNGEFSFDGVRIIKYYGNYFFSIEDLKSKGIIE